MNPAEEVVHFGANALEAERAKHWAKHHESEQKHHADRTIEWCFIGTGIGTCVRVRCCSCKQSYNVTDYDSW